MRKILFLILTMLFALCASVSAWSISTNTNVRYKGAFTRVLTVSNYNQATNAPYVTNWILSRGFIKYKRAPDWVWSQCVTNTQNTVPIDLKICSFSGTNISMQMVTAGPRKPVVFKIFMLFLNSWIR